MLNSVSEMTVLVAGGAGYVGSHTAKALRRAGILPVVLDNLSTGNSFALRYGPFHYGSIGDTQLLENIIRQHKPAAALLFAAHADLGESMSRPKKYFHLNVSESLIFLDTLLQNGVNRIIFSSSCSVYGAPGLVPVSEESPPSPLSPYAESKLMLERILAWYAHSYELHYVSLRYFNAAGADPDGELGEVHRPETHLIPRAMEAALGGSVLQVYGFDHPTPDGTAVRDYIHVSDLADAHCRALDFLLRSGDSAVLNLGTGTGYSVHEVIRAVEATSGLPVPLRYAPRRAGDAPMLISDGTKAKRLLQWTPRHSSLERIVETAWCWRTRGPAIFSMNAQFAPLSMNDPFT